MYEQQTIIESIQFEGIGVHSGKLEKVLLKPAPANHGIIFAHRNHPGDDIHVGRAVPIAAPHATVLQATHWSVSTVEHLMAALYLLGVDNLTIEVAGCEVPILDGSAQPFFDRLSKVGLRGQQATRFYLCAKESVILTDGNRKIVLSPHNKPELAISYDAGFNSHVWGPSKLCTTIHWPAPEVSFIPARTFGSYEQWPTLKRMGLARGSSLENTLVLRDSQFVNTPRFVDECARHKVLDLVGDLALLGYRVIAQISARSTGHAFNRAIIAHYQAHPDLWKLVTECDEKLAQTPFDCRQSGA